MTGVSVIIPNWNRAPLLKRAIDSALIQGDCLTEIIVCDDGSDDNSRQVAEAAGSDKVKWIDCGRNGMPSIPRNKGILAASGEFIAFLDSDDEWLPGKLTKQLLAMKEKKVKACSSNAFRIVGNENKGTYFEQKDRLIRFDDLVHVNLNICSSVVTTKETLLTTALFPEGKEYKAIEDYALWLKLATKTDFLFLGEPLLNYTDEPATSVRNTQRDEWQIRATIFSDLDEWLNEKNLLRDKKTKTLLATNRKKIEGRGKLPLISRIINKIK